MVSSGELLVYTDGSSNLFDSCGCFIIGTKGFVRRGLMKQTFTLPPTPIQIVEYLAVIRALEFLFCSRSSFDSFTCVSFFTDSLQVCYELNRCVPPVGDTLPYYSRVASLVSFLGVPVRFFKVSRNSNPAGFYLSKRLSRVKSSLSKVSRGYNGRFFRR